LAREWSYSCSQHFIRHTTGTAGSVQCYFM